MIFTLRVKQGALILDYPIGKLDNKENNNEFRADGNYGDILPS